MYIKGLVQNYCNLLYKTNIFAPTSHALLPVLSSLVRDECGFRSCCAVSSSSPSICCVTTSRRALSATSRSTYRATSCSSWPASWWPSPAATTAHCPWCTDPSKSHLPSTFYFLPTVVVSSSLFIIISFGLTWCNFTQATWSNTNWRINMLTVIFINIILSLNMITQVSLKPE